MLLHQLRNCLVVAAFLLPFIITSLDFSTYVNNFGRKVSRLISKQSAPWLNKPFADHF